MGGLSISAMGERTQSAITFKEKPEYQNQKRRRTRANNEQCFGKIAIRCTLLSNSHASYF